MPAVKLRQQPVRPADGSRQQGGEKGEEQGGFHKTLLRLHLSPIHVNEIPHGGKEIEGYPRRQQKPGHHGGPVQPRQRQQPGQGLHPEIQIFEQKEHPDKQHKAKNQKPLPPRFLQPPPPEVAYQTDPGQKGKIGRPGTEVEKPAAPQKPKIPPSLGQQKIPQCRQGEKSKIRQGQKTHNSRSLRGNRWSYFTVSIRNCQMAFHPPPRRRPRLCMGRLSPPGRGTSQICFFLWRKGPLLCFVGRGLPSRGLFFRLPGGGHSPTVGGRPSLGGYAA